MAVTNLNNHVRLHTGERPFVCPEPGCDKAYAQVTNLNQHRKRHLNGRPVETTYDCTVCGEQFQQRNHMYNHRWWRAIRTSSARVQCAKLTFPNERSLQQHVVVHVAAGDTSHDQPEDTKRVYPCVFSTCNSQFPSPREHTEHLLRAHQLRVLHAARTTHHEPPPRYCPPKHLLRAHQLRVLHAARTTHHEPPPRRGRPPKILKEDPLEPKENMQYHEVTIIKQSQSQYLPKLKVQSLFQ
ncbi:LOW QUALITY PROTEIN: zinc finger protein 467-like [Manduca sexta]|uniref:LOW QUALITY PROTEIN: zinc finger protein 467-like n=1 Tax=Manduca sexta TaxID=7130 RepID=UPI00188F3058|nr:LOW QUALITY PROTEIN: zinc finger protein 467-like [Manduca sexta]